MNALIKLFLGLAIVLVQLKTINGTRIFSVAGNPEVNVALSGTVTTLDLSEQKIPANANEVVVYAQVKTGYMNARVDGDLVINSGDLQRKIFFRTYQQSAWSYSSNYFTMPIGVDRKVTAQVVAEATGNFEALVQIVGYSVRRCRD